MTKMPPFEKNSASDSLFTARAIPVEDTPIESNREYESTLDRSVGTSVRPIAPSPIIIKIKPTTRRTSPAISPKAVSYTHLRAHETDSYLVCRLLLEKKKKNQKNKKQKKKKN